MKYQTAEIENGSLVITSSIDLDQNKMTSDCWMIQFQGLSACVDCQLKGKKDCGGGQTLKTMKKREI